MKKRFLVFAALGMAAPQVSHAAPVHLSLSGKITSFTQRTGYNTFDPVAVDNPFSFTLDYDTTETLFPSYPWMQAPNGTYSLFLRDPIGGRTGFGGDSIIYGGSTATGFSFSGSIFNNSSNESFSSNINLLPGSKSGEITPALPGSYLGFSVSRYLWFSGVVDFASIRMAPATAAPEPSTWLLMIFGFGVVGYALRRSGRLERAKPAGRYA